LNAFSPDLVNFFLMQIMSQKQKGEAFSFSLLFGKLTGRRLSNYLAGAVVSAGAAAVESVGAACSAAGCSAFFFAHPLKDRTATEAQSINATAAISFFILLHLLLHLVFYDFK
jgi:hypothetical protein